MTALPFAVAVVCLGGDPSFRERPAATVTGNESKAFDYAPPPLNLYGRSTPV